MGQIIMRNWELRDFPVRVNLPFPIRQVQLPIQHVITPIRGLLNPIGQVVLLSSDIHSYPPHHSHHLPPSLSFLCTTQLSSQNTKSSHPSLSLHAMIMSWHRVQTYTEYSIHHVQHTPSTAYTKYSIHQVQHTPSTAYTKYSIHQVQHTQDFSSSIHSHDYELTSECSFSYLRASLHNWLPSTSLPWEVKGKVTLSHSHVCESTNWWIESQHPARRPSTTSKYLSNLARSQPPKCISTLARLQPPTASPNSLDHDLGVHF